MIDDWIFELNLQIKMSGNKAFESIESILENNLTGEDAENVRQVLYGRPVV